MNRELYLCSLLMLAVFAGMIWYLADYVSSNQEALFNNSYNSQQRVLAQENTRGTIYAGTGEVLAQTVIAEDGTSVREPIKISLPMWLVTRIKERRGSRSWKIIS